VRLRCLSIFMESQLTVLRRTPWARTGEFLLPPALNTSGN
jgi:hypothetical protein